MTVAEFAEKLHARPCAGGWMARCPAHEDRSASLSIGEGNGRRVLLHCFAGCPIEKICAALQIRVGDLFSAPGKVEAKPAIVSEVERRIVGLRSRLTPRERVLPVTVIKTDAAHVDVAIARALALMAVHQELVQVVLS